MKPTELQKEIKIALIRADLTQRELSDIMGVCPSYTSVILRGDKPASTAFTAKVITVLNSKGVDTTLIKKLLAQSINSVNIRKLPLIKQQLIALIAETTVTAQDCEQLVELLGGKSE